MSGDKVSVPLSSNRTKEFYEESIAFISSDLYPGGEFVPQKNGRLSLWDLGFRHGFSVYDVGRAFRGTPWQLREHVMRFMRSCKSCHLDIGISIKELEQLCLEICSRNEPLLRTDEGEDLSYLIEATPGEYGTYGLPFAAPRGRGKPTIIIRNTLIDMKTIAKEYCKGVHLVTPSTRHVPPMVMDPKIKTHSRHFQAFGLYEAQLGDPKAVPLFLDIHGNLTETHIANVFLVYDGVLMTPTTRNTLEGISRANVISLAKQLNLPVIERDLQPFHLHNASEAFTSGTSRFVSWVSHYNGVPIGNNSLGPVTKKLLDNFSKQVNYDITGLSFLSLEEKAELGVLT